MSMIINSSNELFHLIEKTYTQFNANNSNANSVTSSPLPVLLIHGHMEDASVWNKWVDLLKKDGILLLIL